MRKMTEREKLDSENLKRLNTIKYENYLLPNEIERKIASQKVNKYIQTKSGMYVNTDFIITIKDCYDNYIFDMVDGIAYTIEKTEEIEKTVNYLVSLKI